ncbi:hypothetical protein GH714_007117 [Hevea brasiliensis]|uniref:Uncharacterized protein n=1 Tax=Hevea brasiliensis TaxID=3981 RepID=A0A6A6MBC0_HEVBR|nr:hypothetical protein GH714_007117 [Hevea brasiliensis]
MAAACHLRSSSLPSKSHPLAASVEEQLTRLKAPSGSIFNKLGALKDFGNLKRMEKKCTALSLNKDSDLVVVVSMLKEVEEISLMVFQSLLSFVSLSKARSRSAGWSIVSKLLLSRQIPCQAQAYASEVENMDVELLNLIGKTSASLVEMQNVLKGLEALDSTIQQTEEELECIYRRLLKSRVSLLNMSNY